MKHKRVVTGTGRCGTSFIMQLLSNCSENTGYTREQAKESIEKKDGLNGGIEHAEHQEIIEGSYWIKNPHFARIEFFEPLLERFNIDCVYIPLRDLRSTALSREHAHKNVHGSYGGYWLGAATVEEQMAVHAGLIYRFINFLEDHAIDYKIISFKRMMEDSRYLYHKLDLDISYKKFETEYNELLCIEKIRF